MATEHREKLEKARELMDDFARRTGLTGHEGDIEQRYLWTDAFAVQSFFGLAHTSRDHTYTGYALKLIEVVHEKLGRYHRDDLRKGWISGLSEEEGKKYPTAGGLRIGKKMPERKADETFNEHLEWERDGQYFHYITRWIHTLLQAEQETSKQHYADWAAELLQAGERFIDKSGGRIRMHWKMSIDLSRPLVSSMGAHDPLEGLICAKSIMEAVPGKAADLKLFAENMEILCTGRNWATTDALGIGGLLLNSLRVAELTTTQKELPKEIRPAELLADSLNGLKVYARMHNVNGSANQRLAFRECGLSLGLRALSGVKERSSAWNLDFKELDKFINLADDIEDFWLNPVNQGADTWIDHLDINAVSLASSIIAQYDPFVFSGIRNTG